MQRLVLVGGGHGHVQVIKALNRLSRPASVHVTLIDPQDSASYSGMVPGCVSKLYTPDQTLIHLRPLAEWASIDYMKCSVVDIDTNQRKLYLNDDGDDEHAVTCVEYDAVSFDIGSATRGLDETPGAVECTIPTRPQPAMMSPSGFPVPMQPLESLPPSQKSPTSDACVGTEETAFNQAKSEPKSDKKSPAPVQFKDDGSGSTDALSMMLGFIFETVFGIICFFLIGLPVRVIKYSIVLAVLYVTLATTWLYLADDNGAMDL